MKRVVSLVLLVVVFVSVTHASTKPVLRGYDLVQYFFLESPSDYGVPGIANITYSWRGYEFWFSTVENRQLFINDPWKYVPKFGGFCSYGIANEVEGWPWSRNHMGPPAGPRDGWTVYKGSLYFNIYRSYSNLWLSDADNNIEKATKRWIEWWGSEKEGPLNTHCYGEAPTELCLRNPQTLEPQIIVKPTGTPPHLNPIVSPSEEFLEPSLNKPDDKEIRERYWLLLASGILAVIAIIFVTGAAFYVFYFRKKSQWSLVANDELAGMNDENVVNLEEESLE
mmetsp:Transcript_15668/g.17418  ORF Transcript_15668/g.17418 Transcript_15668/m.17418 type:complete len:281 (+) Transcript_15668:2-844(+)